MRVAFFSIAFVDDAFARTLFSSSFLLFPCLFSWPCQTIAVVLLSHGVLYQAIGSNDDYLNAMAQHEDKLVVIKFYDQFCRACDEIRPRFQDLSRSLPEEEAIFFQVEVRACADEKVGQQSPIPSRLPCGVLCLDKGRCLATRHTPLGRWRLTRP